MIQQVGLLDFSEFEVNFTDLMGFFFSYGLQAR